jgi:hypothetical protein
MNKTGKEKLIHDVAVPVVSHPSRCWRLSAVCRPSLIAVVRGHTAPVLAVAFSPDGRHVASGSADKTARMVCHPPVLAAVSSAGVCLAPNIALISHC